MSATLNDNFDTQFPKPIDSRFGPYADISTALTQVPSYRRYEGLTIGIGSDVVEEYWWKEGIADDDLILKTSGGSENIDTLTQSEYKALPEIDPNTLYISTDDVI